MSTDLTSSTAQETILVVEDEVLIRMVISEYLRGCGYKVIEAANSDEAIIVLQDPEIAIDVVFSDIDMPGSMDGFALSKWIRANRADIEVVLAGTIPRAVSAATDLCDEGPLPKPYEPQVAVDRIRRLIAARTSRRKTS